MNQPSSDCFRLICKTLPSLYTHNTDPNENSADLFYAWNSLDGLAPNGIVTLAKVIYAQGSTYAAAQLLLSRKTFGNHGKVLSWNSAGKDLITKQERLINLRSCVHTRSMDNIG